MSEAKPVRLAIIDDQEHVRDEMRVKIMAHPGIQLIGEASNGEEAIQLCELLHPEVMLMDMRMPDMDGIFATRLITERWPFIRILILTTDKEPDQTQPAMEAGAAGVLPKDSSAESIWQAIQQACNSLSAENQTAPGLAQMRYLEALAHEINRLNTDASNLPELLNQYLPRIFPESQIIIRLFPDQDFWIHPFPNVNPISELAWRWLRTSLEAQLFLPGDEYPWGDRQSPDTGIILAPIVVPSARQPLGSICILKRKYPRHLHKFLPHAQAVAAHLAGVLEKTQSEARTAAQQVISQELATAGKIQADILPDKLPEIHGWEVAAHLEPARETSGDFFDIIPLANGNWGFVIADVSDKGMGAALFMTLSYTLIRTYAIQYPTLPAFSMGMVNKRILSDTRGTMFVTCFFGVLEPDTGRMRYVNAGHNPPLLFSRQKGKSVDRLRATGMALGIMEDAYWQQKIIRFTPGDALLLYTDGITEAQNHQGVFFGEQRLLKIASANFASSASTIQASVMEDVHRFVGDAPPQDDIALMVIMRK